MSSKKWGKTPKTSFESKIEILAQLHVAAEEGDELTVEFMNFVSQYDLGLPLAHFTDAGLCSLSEVGVTYVSQTWVALLELCEVVDQGFESLEDILKLS